VIYLLNTKDVGQWVVENPLFTIPIVTASEKMLKTIIRDHTSRKATQTGNFALDGLDLNTGKFKVVLKPIILAGALGMVAPELKAR
jgi:hypothetical protein